MIDFGRGHRSPIAIARARDYAVAKTGDSYYVTRVILKFKFGSVLAWERAGAELERPELPWALFTLQVDLIMRRMTSIKLTEAERVLGRGVPALCCRLGIARRDTVWLTFLDVEKTVHESLMRRAQGLRALPVTRSRNLMLKLSQAHLATRGGSLQPSADDQRAIEALRARASDKEICRRWQLALLSRLPKVRTLSDFLQHWNNIGGGNG